MGQREDNKQQKQDSGQESQLGKPGREFALLVRCVQSALTSFCSLFFFSWNAKNNYEELPN